MTYTIVLISFEYPPAIIGGVGRVAADKVKAFRLLGHRVFVVAPGICEPGVSVSGDPDFYPIPVHGNIKKLLQSIKILKSIINIEKRKGKKIDFIYSLSGTYPGFAAKRIGRKYNIPYVTVAHGNEFLRFQDKKLLKNKIIDVYNGSLAVLAISSFIKERLIDYGVADTEKIVTAPNGVDTGVFKPADAPAVTEIREKYNIPADTFVMLTVSRLDGRKSHLNVLRALKEILKESAAGPGEGKNILYLIGGTGPQKERIEEYIDAGGLDGNVRYIGFVDEKDLPALYTLSDLFIMPSVYREAEGDVEGFGLVFLEAGACGTPSIGGSAGGCTDAIEDGVSGFTVDGNSVAAIKEAVVKLYSDREALERMGKEAYRRSTADYEIQTVCERELDRIRHRV